VPSIPSSNNYENMKLHQMRRDDAISFIKDRFPRKFLGITIIPTTESNTKSILHSRKSRNLSDYGGITRTILKACASPNSGPLTHICNQTLFTDIFPDHIMTSIVKPLYKGSYRMSTTNYGANFTTNYIF
jgi:hypothetical protein